jgi:NitT/TauT family transport system substrate-binding protein
LMNGNSKKEARMKKGLLILALITVWVWGMPVEAQTKRKVVFGVPVTPPNVVHIPPYIAKELGFFAENNIEAEFVTFEGGTQTLRGSVAGGLDITGTSSDPAIIGAARGAGTKVLGTYSHKLSQSMLVQGDIKSCKELKGRKIGIQEVGAFNEVMSRAVLATCGLTPKDVQYVPVSTKGRVPGLLTNQIDTAILHVDQAIVAKKKKPELNILVNLWEPLPKWLYAAYIAPEKEIASNRQLYVDIMAALIKANRYIYNNKARTVEIATKYTQQDSDAVAQTYDILANAGAWPVNDGLPKDMVEWTINKQVELGTIKADEKPSYDKLIDASIFQAALTKVGGRLTGDKRWD